MRRLEKYEIRYKNKVYSGKITNFLGKRLFYNKIHKKKEMFDNISVVRKIH